MWAWLRMALVVVVVLSPGGFAALLTYIAVRTLWRQWKQAQEQAQVSGGSVSVRDVVGTLHFKDLVREARAAL
ncbi:hypothetical protein P2318_21175 [Myxococcaceae bacterium GXIMD 01537]